jgi:hypothetical protein
MDVVKAYLIHSITRSMSVKVIWVRETEDRITMEEDMMTLNKVKNLKPKTPIPKNLDSHIVDTSTVLD